MLSLDDIHPIIFGAGALNNNQYGADGSLQPEAAIRFAFESGINAIDTSAYYGDSEILVGNALRALESSFPRESYFLCTKAGRWETNEFDYSAEAIESSVCRSLERLGTTYLDLLLIHDVEFQSENQAITALEAAFGLKSRGTVRYVGFSGLPLGYLAKIAKLSQQTLEPVDVVLNYCNLTIQNTTLLDYAPKFKDAGVKRIINASPLGMSLLRSAPTHDWHPAPQALKDKTAEIAELLRANGLELADIAEQFSFSSWTPTVVGMRTAMEVKFALENLQKSKTQQKELYLQVQAMYGDLMNVSWPSGIHLD